MTALDREVGRTSAFLHHMSIGALSGGLLGAVLGAVLGGGHCFGCPDAGTTIGAGAIFFGGAGAVIGGLAGAASTMSVWEPVPLKAGQVALRLSPVLAPAGLGLRGTVWFR